MALARWTGVVQDAQGNAVSGASIEVRNEAGGALAVLFADREGTVALANPYVSDSPTIGFHVQGGAYRIVAYKGDMQIEWRFVSIGTASELDSDDIAEVIRSGLNSAVRVVEQDLSTEEQDQVWANLGVDRALVARKWLTKPVGEIVWIDTSKTGVDIPPVDAGFIELSSGLQGAGGYNNGKVSGVTVSGSGATLTATATIADADSPMNGQVIRLINTEERLIYASVRASAGQVFNDQMQQISGSVGSSGGPALWGDASMASSGALSASNNGNANRGSSGAAQANYSIALNSGNSPGARTGDRTRAKGLNLVAFLKYKDVA